MPAMNTIERLCRVMAAGVVLAIAAATGVSQETEIAGKVIDVLDGDSITIQNDKQQRYNIRLAGIDAPELNQDYGKKARKYLSELILDKAVTAAGSKTDRNGELVAKVLLYGRDISLEMVIAGFAWHYKQFASEQSDRDRQLFESAELHARKSRFNLWSDSKPMPPWEFRNEPSPPPVVELRQLSNPTTSTAAAQTASPPTSAAPAASDSKGPSGEVLGNKSSKIYHWPGCPGYTRIAEKNQVVFKTAAEAEAAGYRAAKNCN